MSGRFEAHSTGVLLNQYGLFNSTIYRAVTLIVCDRIVLRQRVTVRTNMFEITRAPNAVYYQYDGMCTH